MKDEQFLSKYIQDEYETFTKSQLLDMLKEYRKILSCKIYHKISSNKTSKYVIVKNK